jgi:polygalacturonase
VRFKNLSFLVGLLFISTISYSQSGWDSASVVQKSIIPPVFPNNLFNITTYGAVGDGVTDCTVAINNAINACNTAGGGKVVVPSGSFFTGALYLKSNVDLYISPGATLLFSTDTAKYTPIVYTRFEGTECMNFSALIYAYGEQNIAITGSGTLDGQASNSNWWAWKTPSKTDAANLITMATQNIPVAQRIFGPGHYLRPNFIQLYNCKNILIDSITILRSPMYEVHPVLSQNVTVSNITVNSHGVNNDGCDPECCTDVLIKNCSFSTGDDCIAVKSGKDADGRRVNVPSQNIVIVGCNMQDGHGGITMGSEMTGGIRNVYADSCTMNSTDFYTMLRFKTNTARGGIIENIYAQNITEVADTQGTINVDMNYDNETGSYIPIIRNVFVRNIISNHTPYAFYIADLTNSPLTNLQLTNCTFKYASVVPYVAGSTVGLVLNNVWINGVLYNIPTTGIKKNDINDKIDFQLLQNYPNPFNPSTIISYQLSVDSKVSLKVYNILGEEVATLVNEEQKAGEYKVNFPQSGGYSNAGNIPSGIYFYKLTAGSFTQTKKMILMK